MADDIWSKRFSAYGAMFVTASVFLLMLIGISIAAWWRDQQLFNGMMETVKALVMVAAGFWIGSSNSSQKKDDALAAASIKQNETIAAQGVALATSSPAPVTTTITNDPGPPPTTTVKTEPEPEANQHPKPEGPPATATTTTTPVEPQPGRSTERRFFTGPAFLSSGRSTAS